MRQLPFIRRVVAGVLFLCAVTGAQTAITPGQIALDVATSKDSAQHYAVYVPSAYTTARRWPVILAFDPGGNGQRPVEQFRLAAEKYGYIVIGSNNSRNGPLEPSISALRALWDEMQTRFAVDTHRVYTTGFSGGARIATLSALLCNDCVAGVIACGAGFPLGYRPDAKSHFAYFSTVGTEDFNFPELVELQVELDRFGIVNVRRVFDGPHRWAPPEILEEAVEWMELQAMRRQLRPRDEAFITEQVAAVTRRAQGLEQRDPYGAMEGYKFIVSTFDGLADVAPAKAKVSELERLPAIATARKRENDQLKRERALNRQLGEMANQLFSKERDRATNLESRAALRDFKESLKGATNADEAQVNARVLGSMFALFVEQAQELLRKKDYLLAAMSFEIASDVKTPQPIVRYNASRAYALGGDKSNALRSLREAVNGGFRDAAKIESDEDLKSIRGTKEYRDIVASLHGQGSGKP